MKHKLLVILLVLIASIGIASAAGIPPNSSFTASKTVFAGGIGTGDVNFIATSTGNITNYVWYIDGNVSGFGEMLSISYPWVDVPEAHAVVLRTFGNDTYADSKPIAIIVNPPPDEPVVCPTVNITPAQGFVVGNTHGVAPLTVSFVSTSNITNVTDYQWSYLRVQPPASTWTTFSTTKDATFTFNESGAYYIMMTEFTTDYPSGYISTTKNDLVSVSIPESIVCPVCPACNITPVPHQSSRDNAGVFRTASGDWYLNTDNAGSVATTFHFGSSQDIPIAGDFNGDNATDAAVFRPGNGMWYVDTGRDGMVYITAQFGKAGDIPLAADFGTDGIDDFVIFRPITGMWYVDANHDGVLDLSFQFGKSGDVPVVGKWK